MSIDIQKLLESLDYDTLTKLQTALNSQKEKKEEQSESDTKESNDMSQEELEKVLKEAGSVSKTRAVKPYIFYETIETDQWEFNGEHWQCVREIYNDEFQLRESAITNISLDEDKMMDSYKTEHFDTPEDRAVYIRDIEKFIDRIYDDALIKIVTDNIKGTIIYSGKYQPKYPISIIIQQLPFLDCPASSMGLE